MILCDSAMPYARETFGQFGEVRFKSGREIEASDLKGVKALMIRSVTKVSADLLRDADDLEFVGTATAGFDHLDTSLLEERGIAWTPAPGNNAASVGDYILSAILVISEELNLDLSRMSLGIVGFGHTGTEVFKRTKPLFNKIAVRDLPLARLKGSVIDGQRIDASLEDILSCDIVTLHVPLNKEGADKTLHLLGGDELEALASRGGILINASRGPVVDNTALTALFKAGRAPRTWLDVFEEEPSIKEHEMLPYLMGATAHIAGYSLDSKYKATHMLGLAYAKKFNLHFDEALKVPAPELESLKLKIKTVDYDLIRRLVFSVYDVRRDALLFKNLFTDGKSFDALRKNYRERRELSTLTLQGITDPKLRAFFQALSFRVE